MLGAALPLQLCEHSTVTAAAAIQKLGSFGPVVAPRSRCSAAPGNSSGNTHVGPRQWRRPRRRCGRRLHCVRGICFAAPWNPGRAASPRHRLATWTRASREHWFCRFLPFFPIGFNGEIFFSGTIFGPREERNSESLIQDLSGLGAQMGCTGNDFCASRDGPREFAAKRLHNVVMWIEDLSGPRSARPATDPGDLQQNASTAW